MTFVQLPKKKKGEDIEVIMSKKKEYSQRAHFRTSHSIPDLFMAESVDIKIVGIPAWRWNGRRKAQPRQFWIKTTAAARP